MDGWTYLRKLQNLSPRANSSRADAERFSTAYAAWRAENVEGWDEEFGEYDAETWDGFTDENSYYVDPDGGPGSYYKTYIEPILQALPADVGDRLSRVPVGVLPTLTLNAHTLEAPDGEPFIVGHDGLREVIHTYVQTYFQATRAFGVYHVDAGIGVWYLFYSFLKAHLAGRPMLPALIQVPMTKDEYMQVMGTSLGAEVFVWLHEFAHVHLGHRRNCAVAARTMNENSDVELAVYQHSHDQEFAADLLAYEWFLEVGPYYPGLNQLAINQGMVCPLHFLIAARLVENIHDAGDRLSKHPPVMARFDRLMQVVPTEARRGALGLRNVAEGLADRMRRAELIHQETISESTAE